MAKAQKAKEEEKFEQGNQPSDNTEDVLLVRSGLDNNNSIGTAKLLGSESTSRIREEVQSSDYVSYEEVLLDTYRREDRRTNNSHSKWCHRQGSVFVHLNRLSWVILMPRSQYCLAIYLFFANPSPHQER